MRHSFTILIIAFYSIHFALATDIDSVITKYPKNRLEVGITYANFFDGFGINYLQQKRNVGLIDAVYFKYGRKFFRHLEVGAYRYWFSKTVRSF